MTDPTTPPADRSALRDRIRRALCEADGNSSLWGNDMLEPDEYGETADAVLAVLPEAADLATARETARETNRRLNYEKQRLESELAAYRRAVAQWEISERGTYIPHSSLRTIGLASGKDILGSVRHLKHFERVEQAEAAVERLTADRAAVLDEAADAIDRETQALKDAEVLEPDKFRPCRDASAQLRRMAAEARPAASSSSPELAGPEFKETAENLNSAAEARATGTQDSEALPQTVAWQIEFLLHGKWCPDGPAWERREDAVARYQPATTRPWRRPMRLVRTTTTYVVEAEHAPDREGADRG
ncbi:hypothetical protein DF268_08655 [Streptomyces sp. V2]|uniref:hypothetical protein n=1 Tax=Streptomyces sp. V2 TaxID=1424099 RepID=UPI000D66CF55|nr:hypothetical protein [Streptomyces sp. V2]PWG13926.1 hypothetical protein DF268_08655 [Streptomyces sp. V2]